MLIQSTLIKIFAGVIVGGLIAAAVGWGIFEFKFRGTEIVRLRGDSTTYHNWVKTLEGILVGKVDTIRLQKGVISGLINTTATQAATIAEQREDNAVAEAVSANLEKDVAKVTQEKNAATQQLTALQAKQAADVVIGGIGTVPTSLTDVQANQYYASLKGQLAHYQYNVTPGLSKTIGILTVEKTAASKAAELSSKGELRGVQRLQNVRSYTLDRRAYYSRGLRKWTRKRVNKELELVEKEIVEQQLTP
ncbi:MAG: hypothetical protein JWP57_716 [Spirosoma sp.]|nr:hypothetical protein [Spirosoma sp.]